MQYFRNYELADLYKVSRATVGKWIEAARQGKNELELFTDNGKMYVANTTKNVQIIKDLVAKHSKYRNTRGFKVVTPQTKFYQIYSDAQIYDICLSIQIYHEVPHKYSYFDQGASNFDKYAQRLLAEDAPNTLKSTLKLLELNSVYVDDLLSGHKRINIVDIGVGNALPVRNLIRRFLESDRLGRYLAIDVSTDMLKIAEKNIAAWFNNKVEFEDYQLDFTQEHFANVLASEYVSRAQDNVANLVLFLGGTTSNLREPDQALKVVRDSMGAEDLLVHSQKLDTDGSRRYFDFNVEPANMALAPIHRMFFDLLNIDESLYDVEMGYDDVARQRFIRVRLKVAVAVEFDFEEGKRTIKLNKGDTILVWRAWQQSGLDAVTLLDKCGFHVLQSMETADQEYLLTVSRRKRFND